MGFVHELRAHLFITLALFGKSLVLREEEELLRVAFHCVPALHLHQQQPTRKGFADNSR
jgi:hypothetical protein